MRLKALLIVPFVTALAFAVAQEREERSVDIVKRPPDARIVGAVEIKSPKDAKDLVLPAENLKGIKFMSSEEFFYKYKERKSTPSGLYMLDTELVPKQLPIIMDRNHVTFGADGSVVNKKGEKFVMILGYKVFQVREKQGLLNQLGPARAFAASPFPLAAWSWWGSWAANEGFCRDITSSTGVDAWGPTIDPAGDRVHTNIEQVEAVAAAENIVDDKRCNNCASEFAQANRDFGCFWPAHGDGKWGWAAIKDGSIFGSANW